ncbi:hypothetical protein EDC01DRAFT_691362 [Geopyxis carbonaria]|nr:hypothetical protein EDC01DRAFT_691362 [Geopyxis carbonaria]
MTMFRNNVYLPCFKRKFSSIRTPLPPHPPASGLSKLTSSRSLILIHGVDAPKYLQGVTTVNIPGLTNNKGAYTAFLNAKGRVLFDVFVYPTNHSNTWRSSVTNPGDPGFILECDTSSLSKLMSHIKRYKLRSKFTFCQLEPGEWDVWSAWGSAANTSDPLNENQIGAVDTRAPGFGYRMVLPNGTCPDINVEEVDNQTYNLRRILHGIPEGQTEILEGSALPQESCMDFMGGIDFHKGCYVGQELTIRTHHTGVVRKRILPVQLYPMESTSQPEKLEYDSSSTIALPPLFLDIVQTDSPRRSKGKFLGGLGNVGLALCRLENMTNLVLTEDPVVRYSPKDEFKIDWDGQSVKVKAFVPEWHHQGIS